MNATHEEGLTTDLVTVDDIDLQDDTLEETEAEAEESSEVQPDKEAKEEIPDIIDTGMEEDSDGDPLPSTVEDVAKLIRDGDSEAALKRLAEFGRGVEKLQQREGETRQATLNEVAGFYADLGKGSEQAIAYFESEILEKVGTSIPELYARSIGITTDELNALMDGSPMPAKSATPDKEVAELKASLEQVKQGVKTKEWIQSHGSSIQQVVEKATGLKFPVEVLADARAGFKGKSSVQDIVKAVMKVNPDAYFEAEKAKGARPTAPTTAMVSKGGKSGGKFDPVAALNDPNKWVASYE